MELPPGARNSRQINSVPLSLSNPAVFPKSRNQQTREQLAQRKYFNRISIWEKFYKLSVYPSRFFYKGKSPINDCAMLTLKTGSQMTCKRAKKANYMVKLFNLRDSNAQWK